jgi:hypothetical protein
MMKIRDENGEQGDDERPTYSLLIEGYWWIGLFVLGVLFAIAARLPALWQ